MQKSYKHPTATESISDGLNWVGTRNTLSDNQSLIAEGGKRLEPLAELDKLVHANPKVTILTVCLNSARTIEKTIGSVIDQTYSNIEFIVVDGGSTDKTLTILHQFENHIDYYASEPDRGLYDAMNKGISLATGSYIIILNSDDWYSPNCIEELIAAKKYSSADFVSAQGRNVDQAGCLLDGIAPIAFDESARLRMPLRHETMLVSATIYNEIGPYSLEYSIIADMDFTARLFEAGYSHYEVPMQLLFFRNDGVSNRCRDILLNERKILLAKKFPFLDEDELARVVNLVVGALTPSELLDLAQKYRANVQFVEALWAFYNHRRNFTRSKIWSQDCAPFPIDLIDGPRITVIVPVSNAEKTLDQCLESLLCQSLSDIEIICVDDCSSDRSLEILQLYSRKDKRVKLIKHENKRGFGKSCQSGIRYAKGVYVSILAPSDTLRQDALKTLQKSAGELGGDIIMGAVVFSMIVEGRFTPFQSEIFPLAKENLPANEISSEHHEALLENTSILGACILSQTFARRCRFPADIGSGQETIFYADTLASAHKINVVAETVLIHHIDNFQPKHGLSFDECIDAVEWRRRAFHLLQNARFKRAAKLPALSDWSIDFFRWMALNLDQPDCFAVFSRIEALFKGIGGYKALQDQEEELVSLLSIISEGQFETAYKHLVTSRANEFCNLSEWQLSDLGTEPLPRPLTVATVSTFDHVGAGLGSLRRVEALLNVGIAAKLFALFSRSERDFVHGFIDGDQKPVGEDKWKCAVKNRKNSRGFKALELFSSTETAVHFEHNSHIFEDHDIVHLHWAVGIQDYEYLAKKAGKKPIIWTLADMNAFTGGCHYSEGCQQYKNDCSSCPLILGEQEAVHKTWEYKKIIYDQLENLTIICPSPWLAKKAQESSLLRNHKIYHIPNAFPTPRFVAHNKEEARKKLNLPQNKKLFLFGAQSVTNPRKGANVLRQALQYMEQSDYADNIEVVCFGQQELELNFPTHNLGYISSPEMLAMVYSAADAFLSSSLQDTGPLTIVESLLCGTPVIAFPIGIALNIIKEGKTGYLAKYCNGRSFAAGMEWICNLDDNRAKEISQECASFARPYFDPDLAAERHRYVYTKAME